MVGRCILPLSKIREANGMIGVKIKVVVCGNNYSLQSSSKSNQYRSNKGNVGCNNKKTEMYAHPQTT